MDAVVSLYLMPFVIMIMVMNITRVAAARIVMAVPVKQVVSMGMIVRMVVVV